MSFRPDLSSIQTVMKAKGYKYFSNAKGHDLNIIGVRTADNRADAFNDWVTVSYIFDRVWNFFAFPATTDPGLYYRKNPLNVKGTAVLVPGQYRKAHKVGKHKGYKALEQVGSVTVFRDRDLNDTIDTTGERDSGLHKINIHRANPDRGSTLVHKWSAGCQVLQDPDQFMFLMKLCDRSADKFSNAFTYTLLEEADF